MFVLMSSVLSEYKCSDHAVTGSTCLWSVATRSLKKIFSTVNNKILSLISIDQLFYIVTSHLFEITFMFPLNSQREKFL